MKLVYIVFVTIVTLVVGLSLVAYNLNQPVSSGNTSRDFIVNKGDSLSLISQRLEAQQLIKNRYVFMVQARLLNLSQKLQAGKFNLSPSLNTKEIVIALSQSGSNDYWLKIIPGTRSEEIFSDPEIKLLAKDHEGYLFPDSYLIPDNYSAPEIIKLIRSHFDSEFAKVKNGTTTSLSDSQIVILASILEREGRSLPAKQTIAGILLNRLQINMALQVDASVQYARDTILKKYWQPLSKSDLKITSPFNTYLHPGLPPSPICNPGYDSLYAAFHPIPSDYLFYITGNDYQMHYATTLDEHNANIAKYLK